MNALESLRLKGWSYWAGYNHSYQSFVARAWKPRDKPVSLKCPGGGNATVFLFCVSSLGDSIEDAASKCAAAANDHTSNGAWWNGLPVTNVVT